MTAEQRCVPKHESGLLASGASVDRVKRDIRPTSVGSPQLTFSAHNKASPFSLPRFPSLPLHLLLTVHRRTRLNDVIKALGLSMLE